MIKMKTNYISLIQKLISDDVRWLKNLRRNPKNEGV